MNSKREIKKLVQIGSYLIKLSATSLFGSRSELKSLLTFLYRQHLFSFQGKIPKKSILKFFAENNSEFEYLVYNYYPQNQFDKKISCLGFDESLQLSSLVRFKKPKKILEIGSNKGGTTYNLFINTESDCEISTVDLNDVVPANDLVRSAYSSGRIKTIKTDTKYLEEKLVGEKFDFIFVDAGHYYHEIKNDTEIAFKHLAPKGMIVWHDYSYENVGVIEYLEDLSRELKLVHLEMGTLVVYQALE